MSLGVKLYFPRAGGEASGVQSCGTSTARVPGDINQKLEVYISIPLVIKGRVTDGLQLFQSKDEGRT